eukprot:gnl/TRDRNA2_/TRDRNA2_31476_c0_seq1.p3 gnl/TRDRNA2_/TRDRNA2_31476_c0~~gnl/TRDRNA2_/TRDRNA2_31476_c0_seq1.p3  ORF type:complete len:155 (+),score=28.16 gnl/TRDRNA2_/TRDRNA2_31476_c0_seq1:65-529(+)
MPWALVFCPGRKRRRVQVQSEGNGDCTVCLDDGAATHAVIPCGHQVLCEHCAAQVNSCPVCRSRASGTMRIFVAAQNNQRSQLEEARKRLADVEQARSRAEGEAERAMQWAQDEAERARVAEVARVEAERRLTPNQRLERAWQEQESVVIVVED